MNKKRAVWLLCSFLCIANNIRAVALTPDQTIGAIACGIGFGIAGAGTMVWYLKSRAERKDKKEQAHGTIKTINRKHKKLFSLISGLESEDLIHEMIHNQEFKDTILKHIKKTYGPEWPHVNLCNMIKEQEQWLKEHGVPLLNDPRYEDIDRNLNNVQTILSIFCRTAISTERSEYIQQLKKQQNLEKHAMSMEEAKARIAQIQQERDGYEAQLKQKKEFYEARKKQLDQERSTWQTLLETANNTKSSLEELQKKQDSFATKKDLELMLFTFKKNLNEVAEKMQKHTPSFVSQGDPGMPIGSMASSAT